jgi:hypothetical protein
MEINLEKMKDIQAQIFSEKCTQSSLDIQAQIFQKHPQVVVKDTVSLDFSGVISWSLMTRSFEINCINTSEFEVL